MQADAMSDRSLHSSDEQPTTKRGPGLRGGGDDGSNTQPAPLATVTAATTPVNHREIEAMDVRMAIRLCMSWTTPPPLRTSQSIRAFRGDSHGLRRDRGLPGVARAPRCRPG